MNVFDTWNIHSSVKSEEFIKFIIENKKNNTYLLDFSKNVCEFSLIEKFVNNIALFHLNRLDIHINNNIYVEFWWKLEADTDNFHLDCDEYIKNVTGEYVSPLLSCVTYLNDNACPTVITNVNFEDYKYKNFKNHNCIYLSFPREWKHITFDSKLFHGISNVFENDESNKPRYMLAINLWDKKPVNIEYFSTTNYDNNDVNISISNTLDNAIIETVKTSKDLINFNLFESLLYKKHKNLFLDFGKLINTNKHLYKFIVDEKSDKEKMENSLKTKYGNIMDDINEIMNNKELIKYNRFLQRFNYNKIYSPDICRWIINECELYAANNEGWTKKRHGSYPTTDLPIDLVKPIFNFITESFKTINDKIIKSYCLDNSKLQLNFKDIFVVKYKFDEQNYLDLHCDGSFLSFQILLSNTSSFEGGGTYFDDGLTLNPEQGDLIIHSSRIKHSGLPITKGVRYLLVGFIDLNLEIEV